MRRRDLIAAGTAVALSGAASAAIASSEKTEESTGDPTVALSGVGLPVIVDGRLRNYVFVTIKLTLGAGQTAEAIRSKDPYFRDALVRTAHQAPFVIPGDLTKLHEPAINAAILAIGEVVVGKGAVTKSEVTSQVPRRRTGIGPA